MKNHVAKAVADVTQGMLLATVDIAVAPERVFRAITSEELTHWWGSDELYRTTKWTGDLRSLPPSAPQGCADRRSPRSFQRIERASSYFP
jgi:hypothetical protein